MELTDTPSHSGGGIYNYFQGATINHFVINNGTYNDNRGNKNQTENYSDAQIARAIMAINGKDKALCSKQRWAGVWWYLHWALNYPANIQKFCEKIATLPFDVELPYPCDYNNIRRAGTMSFVRQDPRQMDMVKPSPVDMDFFVSCKEVVLALTHELDSNGIMNT